MRDPAVIDETGEEKFPDQRTVVTTAGFVDCCLARPGCKRRIVIGVDAFIFRHDHGLDLYACGNCLQDITGPEAESIYNSIVFTVVEETGDP